MLHSDVPFRMFSDSYLAINGNWPNYLPVIDLEILLISLVVM